MQNLNLSQSAAGDMTLDEHSKMLLSLNLVNLLWGLLNPAISALRVDNFPVFNCIEDEENMTISKAVLYAVLNEDYDMYLMPDKKGANVTIELALQTVSEISEITASYTVDILLR